MGWTLDNPQIAYSSRGIGPHLIVVSWAHRNQPSKWHLDRFSRFVGLANVTNRHTDSTDT